MSVNYPASLDAAVGTGTSGQTLSVGGPGGESHVSCHADMSSVHVSLETIVGITNSTVTTSHEFRIRRLFWGMWPGGLLFSPAATNFPVFATVNTIPLLSYTQAVTSTATFIGRVPWGAVTSGGGTVRVNWAAVPTTGNVTWGAAFELLGNAAITSDHFGTQTTQTTTVSGSASFGNETVISVTQANLNSVVAGSWFRLQIQRLSSDTLAGAATIYGLSVEATT